MAQEIITFSRRRGEAVRIPMPGYVHQYARNDGAMWFKDEWGLETPVAPDGIYTRQQAIIPDAGATTRSLIGIPSPNVTAANLGTVTTTDDVNGPWHTHTTGAVATNGAGLAPSAFTTYRAGWYPRMRALIKTPATITAIRINIGFFSADPVGTATAPPSNLHGAWFRYDTATTGGDSGERWRTVTGAGAAPTIADTGITIAANSVYMLGIDFVPPDPFVRGAQTRGIKFSIASGTNMVENVVGFHTATLPLANQTLGYGLRVITLTAGARAISYSRIGFVSL